jgi:transposase-like protein
MTRKQDSARRVRWKEEIRQLLAEDRDLLKGLIQDALQQVLEAEMEEALQAEKGERTSARLGYRSGHYSRTLVTRVGKIELRVPQDRQGRFRTEVFERYQRSEKALVTALMEMYLQGVSTRKVKAVTEELSATNSARQRSAGWCRRSMRNCTSLPSDVSKRHIPI